MPDNTACILPFPDETDNILARAKLIEKQVYVKWFKSLSTVLCNDIFVIGFYRKIIWLI